MRVRAFGAASDLRSHGTAHDFYGVEPMRRRTIAIVYWYIVIQLKSLRDYTQNHYINQYSITGTWDTD